MQRYLPLFLIPVLLIMDACSSGRKALERGDYDTSVSRSVNRLRGNPTHKKSQQTLEMAYPHARDWHMNRINTLQASQDPYKWEKIADAYSTLNGHYDNINRCPVCLRIVPEARRYTQEYDQARTTAADIRYDIGMQELENGMGGDRAAAREAYNHFVRVNQLAENHRDVQTKIEEAKFHATLKIVVEPIPMHSRSLQLSNEFFDNKINEFLHNKPTGEFVQFYTAGEARSVGIQTPDHIIQLQFDDFSIGQVTKREQEIQLIKDSVILAWVDDPNYQPAAGENTKAAPDGKVTICHTPPGNPSNPQTISIDASALEAHLEQGAYLGPCEGQEETDDGELDGANQPGKMPVYGRARATLHKFSKTLESTGVLDFRIIDGRTSRVLTHEKLTGTHVWVSEWGYYNGSEKALEEEHKTVIGSKEEAPPSHQELFVGFTQPIHDQVIEKIQAFYSNY